MSISVNLLSFMANAGIAVQTTPITGESFCTSSLLMLKPFYQSHIHRPSRITRTKYDRYQGKILQINSRACKCEYFIQHIFYLPTLWWTLDRSEIISILGIRSDSKYLVIWSVKSDICRLPMSTALIYNILTSLESDGYTRRRLLRSIWASEHT